MFSPFKDEKHIIWSVNEKPLAINLKSGKCTALKDLYDPCLNRRLNNGFIWKDSLSNEVYITCFNKSLLKIHPVTKSVTSYPIQSVVSMLFSPSRILLGTTKGLYQMDRATDSITILDQVNPQEWMRKLAKVNDSQLSYGKSRKRIIINGDFSDINSTPSSYEREPQASNIYGAIDEIHESELPPKLSKATWMVHQDLSGLEEQPVKWYLNSYNLIVKKGEIFYKVMGSLPISNCRDMITDRAHLYIANSEKLLIINKKILELGPISKSPRDEPTYELNDMVGELNRVRKSGFLKVYNKWDSLTGQTTVYDHLRNDFLMTSRNIAYYPPRALDSLYNSSQLPDELMGIYLAGQCKSHLRAGDRSAYERYRQEFIEGGYEAKMATFHRYKVDLSAMVAIDRHLGKLDSLKTQALPED